MSDKYIDLAPKISEDTEVEPIFLAGKYQREVLAWLDEHPDQVPGRTITESELYQVQIHCGFSGTDTRVNSVLRDLRITVVPDPEPTNAEKLETALLEAWDGHRSMSDVADLLDLKGVRAPEESK